MTIGHGAYSKIPPIVNNSFTFGWSDPRFDLKRLPTPDEIVYIAKKTNSWFLEDSIFPRTKATRNVFFVSLMLILSSIKEGGEIIISGFDPGESGYYSTGNKSINSLRISDLIKTNHILNACDRRNERVFLQKLPDKEIVQLLSRTIASIRLAEFDARGITYPRRLVPEFIQSTPIYLEAIQKMNLSISYIGESKMCKHFNLTRRSS